MSPSLKKGIRWAISAAILIFLIYFATKINWHQAWNSMRHASLPLLAAAIGVNFLSVLIKGVRWWLFLRPIGITSLWLAIRATVAGAGLNNLLVVIVLLLVFFVYATRHNKPEHVPERRARPRTVWGRVRAYFHSFGQTAGRLATGPRFLAATLLSLGAWACQLWTFELAAAAAHVTIPVAGSLACLLGINVGLIIRATPGNVGFFQFVYALMAQQFGVSRDDAIAVSLLIQTLQILPLTLLGIALAPEFIFRRGKKDKETEAVAEKIEKEKLAHKGPLSTAEDVLQRADKAGIAPQPKKP